MLANFFVSLLYHRKVGHFFLFKVKLLTFDYLRWDNIHDQNLEWSFSRLWLVVVIVHWERRRTASFRQRVEKWLVEHETNDFYKLFTEDTVVEWDLFERIHAEIFRQVWVSISTNHWKQLHFCQFRPINKI